MSFFDGNWTHHTSLLRYNKHQQDMKSEQHLYKLWWWWNLGWSRVWVFLIHKVAWWFVATCGEEEKRKWKKGRINGNFTVATKAASRKIDKRKVMIKRHKTSS